MEVEGGMDMDCARPRPDDGLAIAHALRGCRSVLDLACGAGEATLALLQALGEYADSDAAAQVGHNHSQKQT